MSKGGLRFLATVLTTGILVTPFLGLDNLPRSLQRSIDAERNAYTESRSTVQRASAEVQRDLQAEPALFRARSMNTVLPERLRKAEGTLAAADRDMVALVRLREANRRGDRSEAEQLLKREQAERTAALTEATAAEAEARRWVELKRNLPQTLEQMRANYEALRAADLSQVSAVVQKAQIDWPDKRADLGTRLDALKAMPAEAERTWENTEAQRRLAAAGDYANLDAAALLSGAVSLHEARAALPARSAELRNLAGQLYDSWDKVLVDLDTGGGPGSRAYREKIRTVRTHYDSPGTSNPQVSTDEQWVDVSRPQYAAVERNLGMAIEHKPAGRYDVEAEKTAQPAGFAYMAPPGQRNQYGYWDNRGGGNFWVWYGQYALLRDLLFNRDYRSPDQREWENYRNYQRRGQTYYGRDESAQAPKYGTSGSATQSRYSGSTYAQRGGFSDSKYATRGYREHPDEAAPRQFGTRSSGGGGIFSSSPSRSWSPPRSSSRPSFGGGGGGRRFGGGGRRR